MHPHGADPLPPICGGVSVRAVPDFCMGQQRHRASLLLVSENEATPRFELAPVGRRRSSAMIFMILPTQFVAPGSFKKE